MSPNPAELLMLATSTSVLAAMLVLGLSKGLLTRSSLQYCPSCGRYVKPNRRCACCG
jgi:hypothetical protein